MIYREQCLCKSAHHTERPEGIPAVGAHHEPYIVLDGEFLVPVSGDGYPIGFRVCRDCVGHTQPRRAQEG